MSVRFAEKIISAPKEDVSLLSRAALSLPSRPSQSQVDGFVDSFSDAATDWKSLASMMAGGMAYRAGRIGVMGLGNSAVLRVASIGVGLTAEVSTFEFTHRGLSSVTVGAHGRAPLHANLWSWNGSGGIRQGLLHSFVTFGALKGAGRLAQGENWIAQHLFQDSAMVLGHHVTGSLGIAPRPAGTLAEQFLHAEATNLQIGAGMAIAHGFAPGLQALERGLDLSLASLRSSESHLSMFQPAFATASAASQGRFLETVGPTIFKMASQGGDGTSGGKPPRRWSFLTLLKGSGPPPIPPREGLSPVTQGAPEEVRRLDKAVRDLLEEGLDSQEFETRRRHLEEILKQVSLSHQRSPERDFFFGLPRNILSQIFNAMEYDAPPRPFQAAHLRVVDEFQLSNEARDLLNEAELRLYFGEKFLTYETYRPEEVTIFQHLDEGQVSLILRSHAVLRVSALSLSRQESGKKRSRPFYLSTAQIKNLQAQVEKTFHTTECLIPGVLLKYEPGSLTWLMEFWAPSTGIDERLFRTMVEGPVKALSNNPEMRNLNEIKIELRTRRTSMTISFARSLGKDGFFQFIPME